MDYSRVHRLLRVITLLQSRRGLNAKRLAEECGVDQRTVFRDLRELEAVGVPIVFDQPTDGYVIGREFFLPPVQLKPEEALALCVLCEQVGSRGQIAHLEAAARATEKLLAGLPPELSEEVRRIADSVVIQTAQASPPDEATDVYDRVRLAIAQRTSLQCRYESADGSGGDTPFFFDPYRLLFSVRSWYALGMHHGRGEIRSLRLSRFVSVTPTERSYEIPADFSVESYLGNAWRLINNGPDYQVEIVFDQTLAPTVTETRWHHTQEVEHHEDGSATFRCTVSGLEEIVWWVLSMGPHCRVTQPPQLAERIRSLAAATAALYPAS